MVQEAKIKNIKTLLDEETGTEWKKTLHPGQVNFSQKAYGLDAIYFCQDAHCQHGVFFVPEYPVAVNDIRRQTWKFLQKYAYQFLPAIKLDLNKFPEAILPPIPYGETYLVVKMKPNGNIILKKKSGESPMAYTPGSTKNFSISAAISINDFLAANQWQVVSIMNLADNNIKLVLKHTGSNVELNIDFAQHGNELVANGTLDKSKFDYRNWELLGSIGFKVSAEIYTQPPVTDPQKNSTSLIASYNPLILIAFLGITAGMSTLAGSARFALADLLLF